MLCDFLLNSPVLSRFFLPVSRWIDKRDAERLLRGVDVSAIKPAPTGFPLPLALVALSLALLWFGCSLLPTVSRGLPFAPLLLLAVPSIALGVWVLLVAVAFRKDPSGASSTAPSSTARKASRTAAPPASPRSASA